jgi:succinoglycan biosynthesis protein ExoA
VRPSNLSEGASVRPLAVVIPTLNEEQYVLLCLTALLPQLREYDRVYVADGGSVDKTVALVRAMAVRDPRVIIIKNPRRTQAAAVNIVAGLVSGHTELLIRADAHNDYPSNFVSCVLEAYEQQKPESVVVRVETIGATCFQKAAAAAQNSRLGNGGAPHRSSRAAPGWVDHGRHALFDLAFFEKLGGYDEMFRANEDAELDIRLVKAGGRIWMCPEAPVRYFPRSTPAGLARQYFHYGAGRFLSTRKHGIRLKNRQLLVLTASSVNFACVLLTPFWPPIVTLPSVYALLCLIWGAILAINARDLCTLASGPAAIIMHMAWSIGYSTEWLRAYWTDRTSLSNQTN